MAGSLRLAVDADVADVLGIEFEVEPGAAIGDDAGGEQVLAAAVGLALVVVEEDAGAAVHLGDDDALGAVDDESAVVRHQGHVAHVDVLLLDVADGTADRFPHPRPRRSGAECTFSGAAKVSRAGCTPRRRISAPRARTGRIRARPRPAKSLIGKTDRNTSCRPGMERALGLDLHLQEVLVGARCTSMRFGIGPLRAAARSSCGCACAP